MACRAFGLTNLISLNLVRLVLYSHDRNNDPHRILIEEFGLSLVVLLPHLAAELLAVAARTLATHLNQRNMEKPCQR